MTAVHGVVEPGFEGVRDAFAEAVRPGSGAAVAVRLHGRPVVDLWAGEAGAEEPWREDTLSVVFSCTKGLVSLLAARLVQEGLLDYDARVADYWPEFAAAGKADVRVQDLLAHRAGLSAPRLPLTTADLADWDLVAGRLAEQEPLWEPGTGYAYHPITHGWLIGEVIRRVTGRSVGAAFQERIAGPVGAEAWIGLPASEQGRVATMLVGPTLAELTAAQAAARTPGVVDWGERAMTLGGALPVELVGPGTGFNDPVLQAAEIPGAGGIGSARALAAIWSAAFTETDGVRLLEDATIERATAPLSSGPPVWPVPGPWPAWGCGFQLGTDARRYLTPSGFGHDGAGGQVAFADPDAGVGFAFLTNRMEGVGDVRATRVVEALATALRLPVPRGL
ncbi:MULTISPECIES: serine hydrolase domain-containing protein [unclassified Rathayibacter]|uniref:serine hydrolase domain-containing protein n=1 Tax=unclassified Rathayibacter TaxID=2609250 RepID=UPI000CE8AF49|nr:MULTISPECIES: serine hydrolase domain-containing protein [unclassified Rathayibacter]PPF15065.1 carboxylesterase [Rathayibacter sp. AY1A4]PPG81539.1 carboxylesterase [Rathayibacter sp. AY1E5]PPH32205.1 carboxylesterase [Rathayibacter sp. AY1C3]PPH66311.1 carboxylesterase [Rathayibacter sp. AY1D7]PPI31269.1 carboxylesterase [Rathayibacter sp. AY1B4]